MVFRASRIEMGELKLLMLVEKGDCWTKFCMVLHWEKATTHSSVQIRQTSSVGRVD